MCHLQVQIQEKYGKVTLLGVTHSSPKRDVKFFAKKGGEIFRYEKNEYILVIWVLKGKSPVNLNKKFEKKCGVH